MQRRGQRRRAKLTAGRDKGRTSITTLLRLESEPRYYSVRSKRAPGNVLLLLGWDVTYCYDGRAGSFFLELGRCEQMQYINRKGTRDSELGRKWSGGQHTYIGSSRQVWN